MNRQNRAHYCTASWCNNFSGCRTDNPVSLFHFPKDNERCAQWVRFSLREDLMDMTPYDLRNKFLCSDHFVDSDFKTRYPRRTLREFACPSVVEHGSSSNVREDEPLRVPAPYKERDQNPISTSQISMQNIYPESDSDDGFIHQPPVCDAESRYSPVPLQGGSSENTQDPGISSRGDELINQPPVCNAESQYSPVPLQDENPFAPIGIVTPKRKGGKFSSASSRTPRTRRLIEKYRHSISLARTRLFRVSQGKGRAYIGKWKNIKDNFRRSIRNKTKAGRNPYTGRRYIYARQLSFLLKEGNFSCSEKSVPEEQEENQDEDSESVKEETVAKTSPPSSRPPKKPMNSEENFIQFMNSPIPVINVPADQSNDDRSFFESIIPILSTLNIDQKLNFRSGVLSLLMKVRHTGTGIPFGSQK